MDAGFQGSIDFTAMDLNKPTEGFFSDSHRLALIDPPRAGMSRRLLKGLAKAEVPLLLYVSCNPTSQLRDLEVLSEKYRPLSACIVDCFPHTPHLEQAVLLEKR